MSKAASINRGTADQPDAALFHDTMQLNSQELTLTTPAREFRTPMTGATKGGPAGGRSGARHARSGKVRRCPPDRQAVSTSGAAVSTQHGPASVLSRESPIVIIAAPGRENEGDPLLGPDPPLGYLHRIAASPDGRILTASTKQAAPRWLKAWRAGVILAAIDVRRRGAVGEAHGRV